MVKSKKVTSRISRNFLSTSKITRKETETQQFKDRQTTKLKYYNSPENLQILELNQSRFRKDQDYLSQERFISLSGYETIMSCPPTGTLPSPERDYKKEQKEGTSLAEESNYTNKLYTDFERYPTVEKHFMILHSNF